MATVSLALYATDAAASLPSTVIRRLLGVPDPSAFVDASTEICSSVRVTVQLLQSRAGALRVSLFGVSGHRRVSVSGLWSLPLSATETRITCSRVGKLRA